MNTTYFLDMIAGNVFNTKTDPALPKAYYIGLSSTTPSVEGTGVTEPSNSDYNRVEIINFSVPTNGVVKTTGPLSFNESTSNWGSVTHYVIYDAPEGGNLLVFCSLDDTKSIEANTVVTFRAGEIEMVLENRSY